MATRTIVSPDPFDLKATLATVGIRTGPGGEAWWVTRAAGRSAAVVMRRSGGTIEAEAWGPGASDTLDLLSRVLGLDDDPSAFPTGRGPMREIGLRGAGLHLGSTGAVFESIVPTVLGQLVTRVEAKRNYHRLVRALGEPAPGPGSDLRVPPTPEVIAALGYEDLHRFGIERKRAQVLIECGRRAARLEEAMTMSPGDARIRLRAVRGIGPWTSETVMGVAYGDRDAVPTGDLNLPSMMTWALAGRPRGTDEEMLELLEPYRPYRRRAVLLVKRSGIKAPKYGPRSALRSHL
jgi:3-methyladenine DNA glycosylase/8-oxoguanine DNA glycosylase